jgi:hypothetical protein
MDVAPTRPADDKVITHSEPSGVLDRVRRSGKAVVYAVGRRSGRDLTHPTTRHFAALTT